MRSRMPHKPTSINSTASSHLQRKERRTGKKMVGLRCLFLQILLLSSVLGLTGQEALELVHRHRKQPLFGVSVREEDLPFISSNVLAAEAWLRSHVLVRYPATGVTSIIVGRGVQCDKNHFPKWDSVFASVKNLRHSLKRWGLEKEIQVSVAFSNCHHQHTLGVPKSLLGFLQESRSVHSIDENPSTRRHARESFRLPKFNDDRAVRESRRLSSLAYPLTAGMPKPMGLHVPSHFAKKPSPLSDGSFTFPPESSPSFIPPANPPEAFSASPPPCLRAPAVAPAPGSGGGLGAVLWCVAKPTVPAEKLQVAMDYACGEGGADCEEIWPDGSCYYPDNIVAHASYAFNSYWQKAKKLGGSCNFDGAAVLINSDPSFLGCHFEII